MITGNEPAMPFTAATENELLAGHLTGLTIRQHFASMAMQSLIALQRNENQIVKQVWWLGTDSDREKLAEMSCKMSDALIKELNKNQSNEL